MANASLFRSSRGRHTPAAPVHNAAGGVAYALTDKAALAQLAVTGCFNGTYYTHDEEQLTTVRALAEALPPRYVAQVALYAHEQGYMKDMPAFLLAVLSRRDPALFRSIFDRIITTPTMLRTFVQLMRSGAAGRKSLGHAPKRMVQRWLDQRTPLQLFRGSIGTNPSLPDIIKMTHPSFDGEERAAICRYLLGREHDATALPAVVRAFEDFKRGERATVPDVPFQMLTALPLTTKDWAAIARTMTWTTLRMNLNTLLRHGVFEDAAMVSFVAAKLANPEEVRKAKAFPYQLLTAYQSVSTEMPLPITNALQDAMEVAVENVPRIDGQVYVLPDVSGSMSHAVTGYRRGSSSVTRCVDVAALVAAAFLRTNPSTVVIPFEQSVVPLRLNPRDSVMTNAQHLASVCGGGTNCAAPLAQLNAEQATGDLVIYVSDNESWLGGHQHWRGTDTMQQWNAYKQRNPNAKLVCIDLTPNTTTQASERDDILNIGGFSDTVFQLVQAFASGTLQSDHLVGTIEAVPV